MAKAFLIRFGTENDFKAIKLQTRELGMALDTERLYLGGEDKNIHIPSEDFIKTSIKDAVNNRKILEGNTVDLQNSQIPGSIAFNTELNRPQYLTQSGKKTLIAVTSDLGKKEASTIVVQDGDVDTDDSNSVSLGDFIRPQIMVFLNGVLVTNNSGDPHQYSYDAENKILKIKECSSGDIIAFF